jgi:hypothetical protein
MDTILEKKLRTDRLRLQNSDKVDMILHLEPWGEQFAMSAGTTLEIIAKGPDGDCLEIVFEDNNVLVYAWTGSVISVFQKGTKVFSCNIPVPPTPGAD